MEQLEDKINPYRSGTRNVVIGLSVLALGSTFDHGSIDEIVKIVGGTTAGWYTLDLINHIRYSSRKDKSVKDKEKYQKS